MKQPIVSRNAEVMGGAAVFHGTRVPVQTLLDYREAGESIDDFLEGFPSVTREHVIAFLEEAKDLVIETASKVLLDECVDWRFARDIVGHDVKTARQMDGDQERDVADACLGILRRAVDRNRHAVMEGGRESGNGNVGANDPFRLNQAGGKRDPLY
jgi:uncharacterized protein (DUF433 family)